MMLRWMIFALLATSAPIASSAVTSPDESAGGSSAEVIQSVDTEAAASQLPTHAEMARAYVAGAGESLTNIYNLFRGWFYQPPAAIQPAAIAPDPVSIGPVIVPVISPARASEQHTRNSDSSSKSGWLLNLPEQYKRKQQVDKSKQFSSVLVMKRGSDEAK